MKEVTSREQTVLLEVVYPTNGAKLQTPFSRHDWLPESARFNLFKEALTREHSLSPGIN
ncbi:hypothetical protein [Ruegeria arenilitoris]|uniref:hypothetical protein n=1 Tax=Ruegeria arenilitoris TaxID=1173585 RepID=UPI00147B6B2A|nr:hypothetical protein [Ruegeria arenilitoris]